MSNPLFRAQIQFILAPVDTSTPLTTFEVFIQERKSKTDRVGIILAPVDTSTPLTTFEVFIEVQRPTELELFSRR